MNILYLADPNSIHDIKWMTFFTADNNCFLLVRQHHYEQLGKEAWHDFEANHDIKSLGSINDFSVKKWWSTLKTARSIEKYIKAHKINVLHIMYAEPNALWAYFKKRFGIPVVLTTRGTDVLQTIPIFFEKKTILARLVAYFYRKAFKNIDAISSTSIRQKESVYKIAGTEKLTVQIIRTGVNIDKILSDTSPYRLPVLVEKKYVFFPRAMRPLYDHELALEAIKLLGEDLLSTYCFVFVDKGSADKGYTQKIQGLMDSVPATFIWLENLDQLTLFQTYKDAELVVMTPLSDGTPVSGIETMLCRVPLLLPPLEYDADLFAKGVAYFKKRTANELVTSITALLMKTERLEDTEISYENALSLADRKKEMTKLGHIYKALCK